MLSKYLPFLRFVYRAGVSTAGIAAPRSCTLQGRQSEHSKNTRPSCNDLSPLQDSLQAGTAASDSADRNPQVRNLGRISDRPYSTYKHLIDGEKQ